MKKIIFVLTFALILSASGANAHGPTNFSEASSSGTGMMGGYGSNAWASGWFLWVHVISFILVWVFLALGIAALWKWLRKK